LLPTQELVVLALILTDGTKVLFTVITIWLDVAVPVARQEALLVITTQSESWLAIPVVV
jgi:hypothetical protein